MAKELIFGEESREVLARGVKKLATAIRGTLGPRGKAVVFERGTPIFSLDGVTILKQIFLSDEAENMGAQLARTVAEEKDREAGDGTTTATILVDSILTQGLRALSAGVDHTRMKKGMDEALTIAKKAVRTLSKPIKNSKEVVNVATISSRDPEIGKMVADIFHKLGKDAIVSVEEGKTIGLHTEIVEGMKLNKGFISPYFMTDPTRGEAVIEKANILLTTQIISMNQDIVKILEGVFSRKDPRTLVIIANDVKGEALPTLIINKLQGRLLSVAVKTPGMAEDRMEHLKDIAALTGATVISEETGTKAEDASLDDLGFADRVVITADHTIIIGGHGKKKEMAKRIAYLKSSIDRETSEYEKTLKKERLAKLKGGVAVIKAGTISEAENMELRYRIEDAVRSAKSAIEEGVVPGGGMALWEAAKEIEKRIAKESDLSYRTGLTIVAEAIREPARQIIENAGGEANVVLAQTNKNLGYNSALGEYQNLLTSGVIDPAKVVRVALENAVSIASMFLITTAVIINEKPKEEEKKP